MSALLTTMESMTAVSLAKFDAEWRPLAQTMVPIDSTKAYARAPEGMVEISGGPFTFGFRCVADAPGGVFARKMTPLPGSGTAFSNGLWDGGNPRRALDEF
jgi:hypothetical protein